MIFHFDRYRNGVRMAEGAKIHHASTPEEAHEKARKLFEYEYGRYIGPCTDEFRLRSPEGEGMTPEQVTAARCKRCNGAGTVRVQRFTIFETDSAAESEFAFRNEVCPECSARGNKAQLDITAARERCEKAQHLSLRVTQCCDVSIDGAIGAALEFIAHARADLALALDQIVELKRQLAVSQYERDLCVDAIAKKDAEIAELRKERNAVYVEDFGIFAAKQVRLMIDAKSELKARIAELERENDKMDRWEVGFRNIVTALVGPREQFEIPDIVARVKALSSALKVAREAIEQAPHDSTPGRYGDPECGLLKDLIRVGNGPCDYWKREALAEIDASTTGLPLPPAEPPQPT